MTENTTEGRVRLAPHEEERLRALLRRSDAFGTALAALEGEETAYPDVHAEYVGVLWEEHRLAGEEFARYRAELGIPGPARKDARRPA
jgi:hypothetical protein